MGVGLRTSILSFPRKRESSIEFSWIPDPRFREEIGNDRKHLPPIIEELRCVDPAGLLLHGKYYAAGQIFVTADINPAAELVHPAMAVKINRIRHPVAVHARIDAG